MKKYTLRDQFYIYRHGGFRNHVFKIINSIFLPKRVNLINYSLKKPLTMPSKISYIYIVLFV